MKRIFFPSTDTNPALENVDPMCAYLRLFGEEDKGAFGDSRDCLKVHFGDGLDSAIKAVGTNLNSVVMDINDMPVEPEFHSHGYRHMLIVMAALTRQAIPVVGAQITAGDIMNSIADELCHDILHSQFFNHLRRKLLVEFETLVPEAQPVITSARTRTTPACPLVVDSAEYYKLCLRKLFEELCFGEHKNEYCAAHHDLETYRSWLPLLHLRILADAMQMAIMVYIVQDQESLDEEIGKYINYC
jgi:hypothetical protein